MMARGQSQAAICKSLGISVMTFHRWRKEFGQGVDASVIDGTPARQEERQAHIDELRLENQRLRKIVTDLMLEKAKAQEAISRLRASA